MSIISFWSGGREETAKTLSIAAISTYLAIKHNYKILVVSTTYSDDTLENCFWKSEKRAQPIFSGLNMKGKQDLASGVEGLAKAISSNKVAPEIITNYTRIVFSNRLEILLGPSTHEYDEYEKFLPVYTEVLKSANKYYDLVLVDLNKGLEKEGITDVLQMSDVIVVNMTQRKKIIDDTMKLRENYPIFDKNNVIYLLGRYDKYSKYNLTNLERYMKLKKQISTIPYNTLFFDACNDGEVTDYFLKRYSKADPDDRNTIFVNEVSKACDKIMYKLQEMQMKR